MRNLVRRMIVCISRGLKAAIGHTSSQSGFGWLHAREQTAETLQDRIEVNKLDITLPGGEFNAATRKQESKGWKADWPRAVAWHW